MRPWDRTDQGLPLWFGDFLGLTTAVDRERTTQPLRPPAGSDTRSKARDVYVSCWAAMDWVPNAAYLAGGRSAPFLQNTRRPSVPDWQSREAWGQGVRRSSYYDSPLKNGLSSLTTSDRESTGNQEISRVIILTVTSHRVE